MVQVLHELYSVLIAESHPRLLLLAPPATGSAQATGVQEDPSPRPPGSLILSGSRADVEESSPLLMHSGDVSNILTSLLAS